MGYLYVSSWMKCMRCFSLSRFLQTPRLHWYSCTEYIHLFTIKCCVCLLLLLWVWLKRLRFPSANFYHFLWCGIVSPKRACDLGGPFYYPWVIIIAQDSFLPLSLVEDQSIYHHPGLFNCHSSISFLPSRLLSHDWYSVPLVLFLPFLDSSRASSCQTTRYWERRAPNNQDSAGPKRAKKKPCTNHSLGINPEKNKGKKQKNEQ